MADSSLGNALMGALCEMRRLEATLTGCQRAVIEGDSARVDSLAAEIAELLLVVRRHSFMCEDAIHSARAAAGLPASLPFRDVLGALGDETVAAVRSELIVTGTNCAHLCKSVRRLAARRLAGVRRSLDFFNKSFDEYDVYGAAGHIARPTARSRFVADEV